MKTLLTSGCTNQRGAGQLLCCFATEYNNVVSADYIRTMTDTVTKQDNEYSPYEPFVNMIKAFYRMELTKVPQGKLTGKDNIF